MSVAMRAYRAAHSPHDLPTRCQCPPPQRHCCCPIGWRLLVPWSKRLRSNVTWGMGWDEVLGVKCQWRGSRGGKAAVNQLRQMAGSQVGMMNGQHLNILDP